MSKQTEALKLALEALEQIDEAMPFPVAKLAQKVIREALAQPEPSAYWHSEFLKYNTTSDHRMMENAQGDLERIKLVQTGVGIGKPNGCQCPACKITPHASDCAVHNEPAYLKGACSCKAQPEQEPVAWMWKDGTVTTDPDRADGTWTPLYTSPPASKPLTDAQIGAVAADIWGSVLIAPQSYQAFARAIEAAHGIKGDA